jgi:preprotein translocase subunit YajC
MLNLISFLLMAPPPDQGGQSSGFTGMMPTLIMFAAIILIFYFLMIRPQKKRQKEHQNMLEALKPGDNVVTTTGMHGTIDQVNDKTIIIKVDAVKFTFEKTAIASKVTK